MEKINPYPSTAFRIPASYFQFQKNDPLNSGKQNLFHFNRDRFITPKSILHKEEIRVTDRPPKLCSILHSIGQTIPASYNTMEQCSYKDRAKRPTSDPVPLVQKAFTSLDKFLLPHPRREQNGVGGVVLPFGTSGV